VLGAATLSELLLEFDELMSRSSARGWNLSIQTPKVLEKMRGAVASKQAMAQSKEIVFILMMEIPVEHSLGGRTIFEFEASYVEPMTARMLEVRVVLPLGYPEAAVPQMKCASDSFCDLESQERFENALASFLHCLVGTPCMLYGIDFIVDNVATAFHRLYSAVFLDVSIDEGEPTRLEIELSHRLCPITAENFRRLCTGECGESKEGCSKKLCYKGCSFYRIVPGQFLHSGDITRGGLYGGSGSESAYGGTFAYENFTLKHDRPWLLSMANAGPNTNGSQFFITAKALAALNGKHVCFGILRNGGEFVHEAQEYAVPNGKVKVPIVIRECGEIREQSTLADLGS